MAEWGKDVTQAQENGLHYHLPSSIKESKVKCLKMEVSLTVGIVRKSHHGYL